jgi:hypothetical protein
MGQFADAMTALAALLGTLPEIDVVERTYAPLFDATSGKTLPADQILAQLVLITAEDTGQNGRRTSTSLRVNILLLAVVHTLAQSEAVIAAAEAVLDAVRYATPLGHFSYSSARIEPTVNIGLLRTDNIHSCLVTLTLERDA